MTVKTFEALASGETLELRIYGPIGVGMFGDGVSADSIAREIKYAGPVKQIVCKFNSPGGSAFDGMAIRSILSEQTCETIAVIQGLAGSAASLAAMGCKTVQMHLGSMFMIHEAKVMTQQPMDAAALKKAASATEALNDGMAAIYADRTGKSKPDMRKVMAAETWLTAEQAIEQGFANTMVGDAEDPEALAYAASFDLKAFGYQHVPEKFAAKAEPALTDRPATKDDVREVMEQLLLPRIEQVPQPSAASNAEALAHRKRETMTIKLIAQGLGLSAEADEGTVLSAVQNHTQFVAELRTLTKTDSLEAALGTIRAFQASHEALPKLQAQVDGQAKQLEDQKRDAIFAADKTDPKGRRLTPAMEEFWASQPIKALEAFMAIASHVVLVTTPAAGSGTSQPATATIEAVASSNSGATVLMHDGKSWEAMSALEKHDLHETDRERYEALKRNFAERGSPRAQSQQQRASA